MDIPADREPLFARCGAALGRPPGWRLFVPGRIEFLGKHTDYAGGRSLLCAVQRGICALVAPRADATVRCIDAAGESVVEFPIDPQLLPTAGHWSNYPMTVARRVARDAAAQTLRGADIAFAGDLPPAAGMSSSSALVVAIFMALDAVNALRQRPPYASAIRSNEDLAGYLSAVESGKGFGPLGGDRGVGTRGGSEDHTAILCCRAGSLAQYGFCPVRHERDVPLPASHLLAVGASGVVAEKTAAARDLYNRTADQVARLLHHWRQHTGRNDPTLAAALRSAPDAAPRLRGVLSTRPDRAPLIDRLEQFIEESEQIVPAAGDALLRHDWPALGERVARSQELAERLLGNQVRETIDLARLAREGGAVAASAFGAGFGGSVWALVERTSAGAFLDTWRQRYRQAYPQHARHSAFFLTEAGPAASVSMVGCGP